MSDEIIWQVIDKHFCAFKLKTTKDQTFCRNEYNVNGLCSRASCPLANSKYATIRSVDGKLYLYMKTAERQHTPKKMWERIKLSRQYSRALEQIDERLIYWDDFLIHKCKQRLTRLTQVAIAERRMALREEERTLVSTAPKVKKREQARERKALVAAKLEKNIEKELLDRLKSGAYGENPLNVDEAVWKKVMGQVEEEEEVEDDEDVGEVEYVEDEDEDEDEEMVDMEDLQKWLGDSESDASDDSSDSEEDEDQRPKKKSKKSSRVEVEYENESAPKEMITNW